MKFTDEELSRVLTAHALGGLLRGGDTDENPAYPACIVQVALEETHGTGHGRDWPWFDDNYQPTWSAAEFLRRLEAKGLA